MTHEASSAGLAVERLRAPQLREVLNRELDEFEAFLRRFRASANRVLDEEESKDNGAEDYPRGDDDFPPLLP